MIEISPTIIWACVGIGLIILEVFTSTFVLLFFGIAGLIVAGIRLLGLDDLPIELIIFAVVGIAGTMVFRKKIIRSFSSKEDMKIDENKIVEVTEDIAAKETGCIVYRGSPWKAFNDSDYDLKKGDSAVILKVEGIQLVLTQK